MARTRGQAFIETGQAEVCAVAARRKETAQTCASELDCATYHDDYRRLAESSPDAILIEVPHRIQDEIALWALEAGFDILIGGCLASNVEHGEQIIEMAEEQGRVVEVGYQRRYDSVWEEIHSVVRSGHLGEPIMAASMALWNADPSMWYYDQEESGGMPLTHMSYGGLNAIRWVLGTPVAVSAMANQKVETGPGRVLEETCGALVEFESGAFLSATASYAGPEGMDSAETRFVFTGGGVQTEADGAITIFQDGKSERRSFDTSPSPFIRQAETFLDAIESRGDGRNPPKDGLVDIRIAEAISLSAREKRTVSMLS
jgi:predicted dehydrogenase